MARAATSQQTYSLATQQQLSNNNYDGKITASTGLGAAQRQISSSSRHADSTSIDTPPPPRPRTATHRHPEHHCSDHHDITLAQHLRFVAEHHHTIPREDSNYITMTATSWTAAQHYIHGDVNIVTATLRLRRRRLRRCPLLRFGH